MKILVIMLLVALLWTLWGYFSSNVEQAAYTVIQKADGYEIRLYSPHIEAQTVVTGPYDTALNQGFSIVAGYIFGGNNRKEPIAMTAPVREQTQSSEIIAMTAPVVARTQGESRVISFVMPRSYSMESLPTPSDPRVTLVAVPERKMAVLRFSWFRNTERIAQMETRLLSHLSRDGIEVVGNPSYAGYNAPWTPPWMIRNEVMVEIR